MTDKEIIQALKKHSMDLCSNCKVEKTTLCNGCICEIERNAIDLINRLKGDAIHYRRKAQNQKQELRRLNAKNENYRYDIEQLTAYYQKLQAEIKDLYDTIDYRAEKIREMEDNLKSAEMQNKLMISERELHKLGASNLVLKHKADAIKEFADRYKTLLETELHWCECADEIIKPLDNLVKEMVGDSNVD